MRVRVSRFVVFFQRGGQLVCDDPLRHRQMALRPAAWELLGRFADWREPEDAERPLVGQLLSAGVLVAEGSPEHRREEGLGTWGEWGTAATYFHLASRTHADDRFLSFAQDRSRLKSKAAREPEPVKRYPDAATFKLPAPQPIPCTLTQALERRRTTRTFDPSATLDLQRLSTLLHWTAGARYRVRVPGFGLALLKSSPSGGSRHPVEVYPLIRSVEGLPPGTYHYDCDAHALEPVGEPLDAARLCGDQGFAADACAVLAYTAVLERSSWKYRMSRTYRTLFLDLGHLSQTAYLLGAALDLGVFFTAAIRDAMLEQALDIDLRNEIPLGVTGIGIAEAQEAVRQGLMREGQAEPGFSAPRGGWDADAAGPAAGGPE